MRSKSLQQIRIATQEDDELVDVDVDDRVSQAQSKKFLVFLQSYWTFREELMMEDGIILKGTGIVIPAKKHEAVIKLIHEGHLGLNKCKLM